MSTSPDGEEIRQKSRIGNGLVTVNPFNAGLDLTVEIAERKVHLLSLFCFRSASLVAKCQRGKRRWHLKTVQFRFTHSWTTLIAIVRHGVTQAQVHQIRSQSKKGSMH
jgi:hypothetical protein